MKWLWCALLILSSCDSASSLADSKPTWQSITGRRVNEGGERDFIYGVKVPNHWIRKESDLQLDLTADTTLSLCEFYILEGDNEIRITLHNFPQDAEQMKIPPAAQVLRWKNQFDELDLSSSHVISDSFNGFTGLFFEGEGILKGNLSKVMGWSMQLANEYARHPYLDREKRADYTIKAVGPIELMNRYRPSIIDFAHTFELIEELPSPL